MTKTLYVTDLDGTLLNPESRVSDFSADLLSRLSEQGARITCATARTPATVEPLLRSTLTLPPAIVMTGAALWDRQNLRYIDVSYIPEENLQAIFDVCRRAGMRPMSYTIAPESATIECYFNAEPLRHERKFIEERSRLRFKRMIVGRADLGLYDCRPCTALVFSIGPIERVRLAGEMLGESVDCSYSAYPDIFNPEIGYLEVFAPGVSKASAVEKLRRREGADRLVVFGDNLNDLPMMAVADLSVAVANAMPETRESASIVIGPNTADSVARFIADDFA